MTIDPNTQKVLDKIEDIRLEIAKVKGVPLPNQVLEYLGLLSDYYYKFSELTGKYKAMRVQFFAAYLKADMTIGKAEGLAKGSEEGQLEIYYEAISSGLLEMINSLKKLLETYNNQVKNI